MDLSMPQLDGWQTPRLIRRSVGSKATIIVISANAFVDGASVAADCSEYLPKPVHAPVLLAQIRQLMELGWLRRAAAATTSTTAGLPPNSLHSPTYPPSPGDWLGG